MPANTTKLADLTDKVTASQKKAVVATIGSYEDAVLTFVDSYDTAVAATNVDWLKSSVSPQAAAVREVTKSYTATVRQLVG